MKLLPIILLALSIGIATPRMQAQAPAAEVHKAIPTDEEFDMSLDQNINTPAIPSKYKKRVATHMDNLRRNLRQQELDVAMARQGEVVVVTIPCFDIFGANQTILNGKAAKYLGQLRSVVSHPEDYKVIVAVYSDDTGDDDYADSITEERAAAIDEYLFNLAGKETYVISYGLGKDDPIKPNNSILNRRANRRCEIYIVPTIGLAKSI